MTTELERQLIDLKQGDHICLIYETMAEQMAAAVPFLKEGLARGEALSLHRGRPHRRSDRPGARRRRGGCRSRAGARCFMDADQAGHLPQGW